MGHPILIVDDEALRSALRMVLEEEGYQVVEAPDGRSALDRLQQGRDCMVVLLDFNMPGMDG
jgi:two-component system response regulator ResD